MPQLADCLNGSGPVLNQYGDIGNALAPSIGTLNENDNPLREENRHILPRTDFSYQKCDRDFPPYE
jgi:hypothetical protein